MRLAATLVLALLTSTCLPAGEPKESTNSLGMKLVPIPAGEFVMGQGAAPPKTKAEWYDRDYDESPAHKVKITTPFLMAATEVTNAQYEKFDPKHATFRGKFGSTSADDEPVTHVSWDDAVKFCEWLSKQEGKPYRLPTEAEWEYACRAGTTTQFYTGTTLQPDQANFGLTPDGVKRDKAVRVGSYPANKFGLFDMIGNVAEWCHDWHGPYESGEQVDPVGRATGDARVVRGWSYLPVAHPRGAARYCRSSNRSGHLPDDANRVTGFRVVQGVMPKTTPLPAAPRPLNQTDVKQVVAKSGGAAPAGSYFVDFRKNKKLAPIPKDAWGPIFGQHNHFTAACVCPNGDVLACWYSTVSESGRECAQAAMRLRAGNDEWDPPSFFFATPDCNTHAPVLLRDGNRIYHFATQSLAGWDDAAEMMRYSDDSGATWSQPRIILTREDPLRMSQPCSAVVTKTGKIVLAVDGDFAHRDERLMVSSDKGKTWTVGTGDMRKAVGGKYAIHPCIFEKADGGIATFLRGPHPMPMLTTYDDGVTYAAADTPFPGIRSGQKSPALKLASGAVLLCTFDTKMQMGGGTIAALSLDDGKTWPHVRKVEGPGGYMSLCQTPNGVIYLIGSQSTAAAFNEAWLKEGGPFPAAK
jgi:sulfatase modifying factor 1